jgi:ABC transporter
MARRVVDLCNAQLSALHAPDMRPRQQVTRVLTKGERPLDVFDVRAGSLMEQLIYPLQVEQQAHRLSVDDARALLAEVDLDHLLDRYGPDTAVQWNEQLSLGEQQRLGMARLMFHKPRYAVLDECTSGVTTDMETRFTDILKRLGCTCITISHRPALVAFHDLVLALDGEGGWQLLPGQRGRAGSGRRSSGSLEQSAQQASRVGGDDSRAADAHFVNAAMSGAAGMSAEEEEGGAERTIVASLLPKAHETMAAHAADSMHAALMRDRLEGVRAAVTDRSLTQQWRNVADVLFQRATGWALVRQFSGIGAIVLVRTLLQVRHYLVLTNAGNSAVSGQRRVKLVLVAMVYRQ